MDGKYKQFNQELYNENDSIAVATALHHLSEGLGLFAVQNPDRYGPDIIVYSGTKPSHFVEVEVKRVWQPHQEEFPWSTLQIPERKRKFVELAKPVDFWIFRSDLKMYLSIPDKIVMDSPLVEVPNKYTQSGELFYQVPVHECTLGVVDGSDGE